MLDSCAIVRDLLPLCYDGVCSEESARFVKQHLEQCEACRALYHQLETEPGDVLWKTEKERIIPVIERQKKQIVRKSTTVGLVFAGVLCVPIFVCLLVNLIADRALNWFFIVWTALLLAASLTVVPLLVPKNRLFWAGAGAVPSLLLLLLSCNQYTQGSWFWIAASGSLFGLSVFLLPIFLRCKPLSVWLYRYRMPIAIVADTVLYVLLMLAIGARYPSDAFQDVAIAYSVPAILWIWLVAGAVRYLPFSKYGKGSAVSVLCAMLSIGYFAAVNVLFAVREKGFDLCVTDLPLRVDSVQWLPGAVFLSLALLLGFLEWKKNRGKNQ